MWGRDRPKPPLSNESPPGCATVCVFLKEKEKKGEERRRKEKKKGERRKEKGERRKEKGERRKEKGERRRRKEEKGEGDGDMLNIRSEMPAPALPMSEDGGAADARQRNFNPAVTLLSQRI